MSERTNAIKVRLSQTTVVGALNKSTGGKCQWLVIMTAVLSGHSNDVLNSTVLRSFRNAFSDKT